MKSPPAPALAARALQRTGLKATLPRMRVLRVFQQSADRHWSAEEVYRHLVAEGADVGLATIYRVLSQLEQAGVLRRSRFDAERAVYELDRGEHHDHIVCLDCGRIEEFADTAIEARQQALAADRGFALEEHALALYARCQRACCPNRPPHPAARTAPG